MNIQTGLLFNEAVQEKGQRVENDYYPTPEALTRILIANVPQLPEWILEPCAGQSAISAAMRMSGRKVEESDIQWDIEVPKDATTKEFWDFWSTPDPSSYFPDNNSSAWATITNPPFNLASQILPLAYEYSPWGVAFLLRLSYLEPAADRSQWLKEHADNMRYFIPVNPRPQFRRDTKGCDSSTVAWMVWMKGWSWKEIGVRSPFQFEWGWK